VKRRRGQPPAGSRPVEVRLSRSPEETAELGSRLARELPVPSVVSLRGSLGAGKTTLARGLAAGLGLADPSVVASPSFTLVNMYSGSCPIYHVDLYRIGSARELDSLGLEDFLGRDGVTLVEWAERLPAAVDPELDIEIEDAGSEVRMLRIARRRAPRRGKSRK
jgi:tRNA threonylcarbamoyladenosine biosynthesis protein TsaE